MVEGTNPCPDAYEDCVVVQKLKEGARELFVFDKNYTIQRHSQPVADPPQSEIASGERIRQRLRNYPVVFSSAQTLELSIDSVLYRRSRTYGYNRRPPRIRLPDGGYTSKPEEVRGWGYHLNPDAFIGFGTGIYPRKNGGYMRDTEFEKALGGPLWRPQFFEYLDFLFPDRGYWNYLTPVDRGDPDADVQEPEFRTEFVFHKEEGRIERYKMHLLMLMGQLGGRFTQNAAFVDESNPFAGVHRLYVLPKFGTKDLSLERFLSQAVAHAGVPMSEMKIKVSGDAPPDVMSGLSLARGAGEVQLWIAAKSRIAESILNNEDFGGMPLPGCPNHPELPGRFHKTDMPGVLWWHGAYKERPRKVVLLDYAPWSSGLECTESVEAQLEHEGFR